MVEPCERIVSLYVPRTQTGTGQDEETVPKSNIGAERWHPVRKLPTFSLGGAGPWVQETHATRLSSALVKTMPTLTKVILNSRPSSHHVDMTDESYSRLKAVAMYSRFEE